MSIQFTSPSIHRRIGPPRVLARHVTGGVAAIELAFLLTPLVLITFGATEIGRAIYTYNTLDKTVRDAARYLSQHGAGDPTIRSDAECLAVYGRVSPCPTSGPDSVAPGLTISNVTVCDSLSTGCTGHKGVAIMQAGVQVGTMDLVSVSITGYQYNSLVSMVMPTTLNFNSISCTLRAQL